MDRKQLEQEFLRYYQENREEIKPEHGEEPWLTCEAGLLRDCVKKKEVTFKIPDGCVREEHFDYSTEIKKGNANVYWKHHDSKDGTIVIEVDSSRPDGKAHAAIHGVYAIKK